MAPQSFDSYIGQKAAAASSSIAKAKVAMDQYMVDGEYELTIAGRLSRTSRLLTAA
jgi:hypothetical protein